MFSESIKKVSKEMMSFKEQGMASTCRVCKNVVMDAFFPKESDQECIDCCKKQFKAGDEYYAFVQDWDKRFDGERNRVKNALLNSPELAKHYEMGKASLCPACEQIKLKNEFHNESPTGACESCDNNLYDDSNDEDRKDLKYIADLRKSKKTIREGLDNSQEIFDLKKLSEQTTGAKAIKYVNECGLPLLGKGSARDVFDYDSIKSGCVLKVAKNVKGIAQNRVEADIGQERFMKEIVTSVLDADESDKWIICEKSEKITKAQFKKDVGYPFDEFCHELSNKIKEHNGRRGIWSVDEKFHDVIMDSEFFHDICDLVFNYDMPSGDLERIGSYGESAKLHKVVIRDYGLTNSLWNTYYNKSHKDYFDHPQNRHLHKFHESMSECLVNHISTLL